MKDFFEKYARYKHYFYILGALLIANFVLSPLMLMEEEQKQRYSLLVKQSTKLNSLLNDEEQLEESLSVVNRNFEEAKSLFDYSDKESIFKLNTQSRVEKILSESGCDVDRIEFKGSNDVLDNFQKWVVELRFKGDGVCLVSTTRGLESLKPLIRITDYNFNHRSLTEEGDGLFNAYIVANVWHLTIQ